MLAQIARFLIDTVFTFLVFLLLLRFHFQWLRVSFHNAIGEFVLLTTNWIVRPARRIVPSIAKLDVATLIAALVVQAVGQWLQLAIAGVEPGIVPLVFVALVDLLRYSLYILMAAVIIQVVLSWVNPYTDAAPVLDGLTRPFLRPLRRFVPPIGNFDLTPLVLIILLQIVLIVVWNLRAAG